MAGDWIPMRTDLWECPEVVRLLSAICPDSVRDPSKAVREKSKIIGALFRTWSLFDTYTDDGILHGYTCEVLNAAVGIDGWAENLQHIGWLSINEQSLSMPGFETWLSSSAKARLKDSQRKRNSRKDASESCPKVVRKSADKSRTTGEESREENNTEEIHTKPKAPSAPRFTPPTVEEVQAYCESRSSVVDASAFVDFYSSKGWKVGPNTMKDWQAAVRTWERNSRDPPPAAAARRPRGAPPIEIPF